MRGGLSSALSLPQAIQGKFADFAIRLDGDGLVGVAVSGGGDSVALLYALAAWGKRPLEVFCVDHGLNPLSAQWTQSVADHAAQIGAGFTALYWQGEKPATGVSAAARMARHRLLADAARSKGVSVLCLAHTSDDIAEAEAMRAGGSTVGTPKVWGPSPVWPEGRDVFLYRPFLDVRRDALRNYLRDIGANWIDDPANDSAHSLRARTRKALRDQAVVVKRPEAAATITPDQMQDLLYKPEVLCALGMIAFKADIFDALTPETARKLLSAAAVCAGGGDKLPKPDKVVDLMDKLRSGKPQTLAGARIERRGGRVSITREAGDIGRNRPDRLSLIGPDEAVWDGRFVVRSIFAGEVTASGHLRGDLPEVEKAWLKSLPAALRTTQPVFIPFNPKDVKNNSLLTVSASSQGAEGIVGAHCLVATRLRAALGLIPTESAAKRAKNDCVLMRINGV